MVGSLVNLGDDMRFAVDELANLLVEIRAVEKTW